MKKIYTACFLALLISLKTNACDFSEPDKIKHIEYSKKATLYTKKFIQYPLMITRPLKYLVGEKSYIIFPENYIPQIVAAPVIFTLSTLKEIPFDLIIPGRDASFCDICANCKGIKEGLKTKTHKEE